MLNSPDVGSGSNLANSLLMQDYSIIEGLKTGLAAILMPIFLHPGMHQTRARATKTLNCKKVRGCYHGPTPNQLIFQAARGRAGADVDEDLVVGSQFLRRDYVTDVIGLAVSNLRPQQHV